MQIDINKTKSRCYNFFLRSFHMGLRILVVLFSTKITSDTQICSNTITKFVIPLALALTILNLFFIIYFVCRQTFPRCEFFLFLSVNVIICSVMGLLTYSYFNNKPECKKTMILQKYIVLQIIFSVFISLLVLLGKFQWQQRYTNTPGNLIWTIIIIQFSHDMHFIIQIQLIAWITAAISVATLAINVISLISGITPFVKKAILIEWIIALGLIVVCVMTAVVVFLNNYYLQKYANEILSNICLKYILVSVIDLGFWVWGLLTLTYENGDFIRNAILYSDYQGYTKEETQFQIEHYINEQRFSIKHHEGPFE